jgi:hypothetical protein
MATKHLLPLVSVMLAAACAAQAPVPMVAPPERPVFVQYRPNDPNRVKLTGDYHGILKQRGSCLGLMSGGRFATIIWPATARLSFDQRGLLLRDTRSGSALRLGDYLQASGGPLPPDVDQPIGGSVLTVDMPIECAHWPGYAGWIGIVNSGFTKGRPPRQP